MSDIPDLAEEIDRKAITELQLIMHGVTSRRTGIVAGAASLQTLWNTMSGLVTPETMTLIGESATTIQKALQSKDRPEEVAVFVGPTTFAIVQRLDERVLVRMGTNGTDTVQGRTLTPPIEESNPGAWCVEKFKTTCAALGTNLKRAL